MKKLWAVVIGAAVGVGGVCVGQSGNGVAKRAMTFADLMAMKRVSDPQVSPSGRWVMFSVTEVSLEKNTKVNHLWVVPLGGGGETKAGPSPAAQDDNSKNDRQVTFGAGESFGRFSPDGRWVSFTAPGVDGPDRITVAAWDEKAGTIGEGRALTGVSGDVDGAVWSPDSKRLMFTAMVWPECSVVGGGGGLVHPTHDGGTVMDGAPGRGQEQKQVLRSAQDDNSRVGGTREVGGASPTHRDGAAMNGAPGFGGVPASWAEEDACDKAKDGAAASDPVKGRVWDGLLYRHWDHYTGQKRSHVLVMDADGGNVRDLTPATAVGDAETPTWMLGGPQEYAWAPDSREVAYVANLDAVPAASTNNDVFTLRLDEAGAKAVKVSTSPGSDDEPEYSPDGKWLAFRSQARAGFESDRFRLVVMDRGTKAIRELMPHFDGWIDEFAWSPDAKLIYAATGERGGEPIIGIETDGPNAGGYDYVAKGGEFSEIAVLRDGSGFVASKMTAGSPTEIVSRLGENAPLGTTWAVTHVNDRALSRLDLSKLEAFWFTGAEGTKVEGFLLKPPGFVEGKKYPVKFLMHGGPQTAWGDSWSYRWNWELMAASGYVVVGINRRGSTGYGQKFIDEVSGDWGGRAYEDLMKGLDYAEAHYPFIDKTRECALGASYGGFMADWVLTHTDRFKCIVTHDGMYDPVGAYGSTEEMWFNEWEFRRAEDFPKGWDGFGAAGGKRKTTTEILTGGQTDEQGRNTGILRSAQNDKEMVGNDNSGGRAAQPWRYASLPADEDPFRRWSPMRFIERAKTPTLVIHSQKDYRLDVSQGFELFTALQRLGVPSKMLYFPDEGHWVLKPQNSELWYEEVGEWCDRWTKTGKYAEAAK